MSDAEWDADDFEPSAVKVSAPSDKWAGEDEEDEVKDNWDDEEEEDGEKKTEAPPENVVMKKKKKPIGDRIREKEEKRRKELEEKRKKEEEEKATLTAEEIHADKMQKLRLQKESDLEVAKDTFGVTDTVTIDNFHPVSKDDYEKLASMLKDKLTQYESSINYLGFVELLFRDLVAGLNSDDIKKLGSTLNAVANEKQKQQKSTKGKKKKKGPSVKEGEQFYNYDEDDLGAEFDGFI